MGIEDAYKKCPKCGEPTIKGEKYEWCSKDFCGYKKLRYDGFVEITKMKSLRELKLEAIKLLADFVHESTENERLQKDSEKIIVAVMERMITIEREKQA